MWGEGPRASALAASAPSVVSASSETLASLLFSPTNRGLNLVFIFYVRTLLEYLRLTGAAGATLTTCGLIPDTAMAPLGGRFLLVTDAQENGCGRAEKGVRVAVWSRSVFSAFLDVLCFLPGRSERARPAPKPVLWWALRGWTASSPSARRQSAFLSGCRGPSPPQEPPGPSPPPALDWPPPPHRHRGRWAQNCQEERETLTLKTRLRVPLQVETPKLRRTRPWGRRKGRAPLWYRGRGPSPDPHLLTL